MSSIKAGVLCGVGKDKDFEFFNFVLKEEFDDKYEGLRKLEERGARFMYRVDLPAEWQNKPLEECQEIVKIHKFDFSMLSRSFKHQCLTTKADIQFLLQFPELKCLDICGDELDLEDIKALNCYV